MTPGMIGGHGAGGPNVQFLGSAVDTSNGSSFSFTAKDFGAAAADRMIVVAYAMARLGTFSVSSVTVGGIGGTSVVNENSADGNRVRVGIHRASVPTGTSGTIAVTADAVCDYCAVAWFAVTGLDASAATGTWADDGGDPLSAAITVRPGGFAIGAAASSTATGFTWSGLDELVDVATDSNNRFAVAAHQFDGGASGQTVTADPAADAAECLVVAAWR